MLVDAILDNMAPSRSTRVKGFLRANVSVICASCSEQLFLD